MIPRSHRHTNYRRKMDDNPIWLPLTFRYTALYLAGTYREPKVGS